MSFRQKKTLDELSSIHSLQLQKPQASSDEMPP